MERAQHRSSTTTHGNGDTAEPWVRPSIGPWGRSGCARSPPTLVHIGHRAPACSLLRPTDPTARDRFPRSPDRNRRLRGKAFHVRRQKHVPPQKLGRSANRPEAAGGCFRGLAGHCEAVSCTGSKFIRTRIGELPRKSTHPLSQTNSHGLLQKPKTVMGNCSPRGTRQQPCIEEELG